MHDHPINPRLRCPPRLPRLGLCWVVLVTGLAGCRGFENHRAHLEALAEQGQYDQAAALLDDPETQSKYGQRSDLLWKLDRGAVALYARDPDTAVSLLDGAERQIDLKREKSGRDQLASWTVNDGAAEYVAEPYEDIYLNVLKLLAHLSAGRLEGGATVEARRLGSKTDRLRDIYLKYEDQLEAESRGLPRTRESLAATNRDLDFIESTLGTYLAAIAFMKSGDTNYQSVAGRRLISSIQLQEGLIGPVRAEDFEGLGERDSASVSVLVVALSGRGPTKYAERFGPVPIGTVPIYFELPRLAVHPSTVTGARVEVRRLSQPAGATPEGAAVGELAANGAPESHSLKLVEDLGAVALANHERTLPLIHTRTMIRVAAKAAASATVTEVARASASDNDQGLVQVVGVLGGLVFMGATEKADLRCWMFLPGQAHVGTLDLPEGEYEARVVYESDGGRAASQTPWQKITVHGSDLTSIVTYFGR